MALGLMYADALGVDVWLAIGNLSGGRGRRVTMGIVSALGRTTAFVASIRFETTRIQTVPRSITQFRRCAWVKKKKRNVNGNRPCINHGRFMRGAALAQGTRLRDSGFRRRSIRTGEASSRPHVTRGGFARPQDVDAGSLIVTRAGA